MPNLNSATFRMSPSTWSQTDQDKSIKVRTFTLLQLRKPQCKILTCQLRL